MVDRTPPPGQKSLLVSATATGVFVNGTNFGVGFKIHRFAVEQSQIRKRELLRRPIHDRFSVTRKRKEVGSLCICSLGQPQRRYTALEVTVTTIAIATSDTRDHDARLLSFEEHAVFRSVGTALGIAEWNESSTHFALQEQPE